MRNTPQIYPRQDYRSDFCFIGNYVFVQGIVFFDQLNRRINTVIPSPAIKEN